jgi:ABC-type transporter Mla subunit MlaD
VSELVDDYLAQMDRLLGSACRVFPSNGQGALAATDADTAAGVSPPQGGGGLGRGVEQAAATYHEAGARMGALQEAIRQAVREAATDAHRARSAAAGIRDAARAQAAAIRQAAAQAPEELGALVSTMDDRLAAAQGEIGDTRQRLEAVAARIRQHATELAAVLAACG